MKTYYLQSASGKIEKIQCESDEAAFRTAQRKSAQTRENWKAYDDRENLICGVYNHHTGETFLIHI